MGIVRLSDPTVLEAAAKLLKATLERAPAKSLDGQAVYRIRLWSKELEQPLVVDVTPSEGRVDVRVGLGHTTWTLKQVTEVKLLGINGSPLEGALMAISRHTADEEVQFCRLDPPAQILISSQGKISLVA